MIIDSLWAYNEIIYECNESVEPVLKVIQDFPSVDEQYKECLSRGEMYAFCKSLRIFGLTNAGEARNVIKWNNPDAWKSGYKGFFSDAWSFAEDVFGFQYLFERNGIVQLNIETGQLKPLCRTFSEWVELVLERPDFYTGYSVSKKWNEAHPDEPVTGKYHLCPVILFVCNGSYEINNLFLIKVEENLGVKAQIAQQIKNLPDGTPIKFSFY